jgi:hypothetical protein
MDGRDSDIAVVVDDRRNIERHARLEALNMGRGDGSSAATGNSRVNRIVDPQRSLRPQAPARLQPGTYRSRLKDQTQQLTPSRACGLPSLVGMHRPARVRCRDELCPLPIRTVGCGLILGHSTINPSSVDFTHRLKDPLLESSLQVSSS